MSAREWTVAFRAPAEMLSVNTSKHWAVTSTAKATWRAAMHTYVQQARLPKGLDRVRIEIVMRFPTAANRDESNYHHLVGKPIVDALGRARRYQITRGRKAGQWVVEPGYELIPDDNPRKFLHCRDCPHLFIADERGPRPYGDVTVTITDLSEGGSRD